MTEQLIPGERRDLAILFLDLKGFTAMSETMDHEMVHKIVGGIMQALSSVVKGHGGYVDMFEGDQIMALFGATIATENDCIRAVACGLKMFDVIREANQIFKAKGYEIGARCGISYGSVTVAPDPKGNLTAIGDEVNLTSRMESTAEVNTVQVSEHVRKEGGEHFAWEDLGEITVKGKKKPVHTFRPTGPGKVQKERWERAARVSRSPMVGREKEMEMLQSWWDRKPELNPRGGAKHFVIGIKAEAGIGKSRLVHEFIKSKGDDFILLKGQTLSYAQPPFWLWITLLWNYFGISSGDPDAKKKFEKVINGFADLEDSSPFLATLLSIPSDDPRLEHLDDKAKHQETLIGLRNLIRAIGNKDRTLIVFEDLHWLDSSSKEGIEFVLANCDIEKPLLCLCLYRPEEETTQPEVHENYIISDEINLSPIDETACKQLISFMLGSTDAGAENFLLKQSQGNPFFLEELILDMIESGSLNQTDGEWNLSTDEDNIGTPSSMSSLLHSRIDRLPSVQKEGLQHSSVIGMEFLLKMYRRLKEKLEIIGEHEEVLTALEKREFIHSLNDPDDLKYIFKHILLHNTTYDTILHHNRAILHRFAAEAIEEMFSEQLEEHWRNLAEHFEKSEVWGKAAEYLLKAADQAKEHYDNQAALELYDRLLQLVDLRPEASSPQAIVQARLGKGAVLQLTGDWQEALQEYQRAVDLTYEIEDRPLAARTLISRGALFRLRGEYDPALIDFHKSLAISEELGDKKVISESIWHIGNIDYNRGDYDCALKCFRERLSIAEESGDKQMISQAVGSIGIVLSALEEYDRAMKCYQKALFIAKELGDKLMISKVFGNTGDLFLARSDYDRALEFYQKQLSVAEELGDKRVVSRVVGNMGELFLARSDYDSALEFYQKQLSIAEELGDKQRIGMVFYDLGLVFEDCDDYDHAIEYYQKALSIGEELGDKWGISVVVGKMGSAYFETKNYERAEELLDQAIEIGRELSLKRDMMEFLPTQARLALVKHQYPQASNLCSEALTLARELKNDDLILQTEILSHKVAFTASDGAARSESAEALKTLLSKTDNEEYHAEINYELWQMHNQLGNNQEADSHHEEALKLYKTIYSKKSKYEFKKRIEEMETKD